MDFANLTANEAEALQGPTREAFYAWRRGDVGKVQEIADAYGLDFGAPSAVETPEGAGPVVESPEKPARRPRKAT